MKLFGNLYHEDGEISYKDESERTIVKMAFNIFYPTYKSVKEKHGDLCWTEEECKVFPRSTRFGPSSPFYFT
jgi:hypothetical protein